MPLCGSYMYAVLLYIYIYTYKLHIPNPSVKYFTYITLLEDMRINKSLPRRTSKRTRIQARVTRCFQKKKMNYKSLTPSNKLCKCYLLIFRASGTHICTIRSKSFALQSSERCYVTIGLHRPWIKIPTYRHAGRMTQLTGNPNHPKTTWFPISRIPI